MRIALVSVHTSPGAVPGTGDAGGMNVVVAEHARALSARGHDVHVVTRANASLPPGETPLDPQHPSGPRLHAIAAGAPDLRKSELLETLPEFSRGLTKLGPFDAVHAHYWLSGVAAGPVAAAHGATLAFSFHTVAAEKNARLAPSDHPEPALRLGAERALAHTSRVIAGSASEAESVISHYGAPVRGVEVIHPGVDTRLFRPRDPASSEASGDEPDSSGPVSSGWVSSDSVSRSSTLRESATGAPLTDPSAEALRITVLGRVQPLKGQELAVRAFGEIARHDASLLARTELVIAGEPTPGAEAYASGLRTLADDLGIAQRVRFLPAQDRTAAAALLASSDVVVIPSYSETFGLVALEAAASGVPAAAGAHTGLREAAPEHISALHVNGRDPAAWARAITTLLTDPVLRTSLGARARAFALRHSWEAQAAKLEEVYRELRLPARR